MWLAKLISLFVIIWAVRWFLREWRKPTIIYWQYLEYLPFPVSMMQDAVAECFGRGDNPQRGLAATDFYARGDARIRRVSDARRVPLSAIPSKLSIGVGTENGKTLVSLRLDIDRQVRMSRRVAQQYDSAAEAELTAVMQRLQQAARALHDREAQRQSREHEQQRTTSRSTVDEADYGLLGLKPGASPEQVRKAYRIACRKYHPDRLTGQNVEPHLVELAVQRFKEVGAAYQRIRDRLGQPQHA